MPFFLWVALLVAAPGERVVESVVPWLAYDSSCSSEVTLRNLGDRAVNVAIEGHRSSGALAGIVGQNGIGVRLDAGERASYKFDVEQDTAWVRVRERIPSPDLAPVLAVSGTTECVSGDRLVTVAREVAWPMRNPFYSGDVKAGDNGVIALINVSERPAMAWGCYSSGTLYSNPREGRPGELMPVCSDTVREQVPPFGTRQFPVSRGGNSHFALHTRGNAIVIELLRPAEGSSKAYRVDSTISFGDEATGQNPQP